MFSGSYPANSTPTTPFRYDSASGLGALANAAADSAPALLNPVPQAAPDGPDPCQVLSPTCSTLLKTWCEMLGNKFNLEPEQYSDLLEMANLGSCLDVSDMRMRLYQQATTMKTLNIVASQNMHYNEYKSIFHEVQEALGKKWRVSEDQKTTIRLKTRDFLFQPHRTSWINVSKEVEGYIRDHAKELGFDNAYGNPTREAAVGTACREIASQARNQYRKAIVDSILPNTRLPLEEATYRFAHSYKMNGPGKALGIEYQIRVALHRRWAFDNIVQNVKARQAYLNEPDNDDLEVFQAPDGPVTKRKRVVPTVGKVAKGQDFWSCVARWWSMKMSEWGTNYENEMWRPYISETIERDKMFFGTTNTAYPLAPLPMKYMEPVVTDPRAQEQGPQALSQIPAPPFAQGMFGTFNAMQANLPTAGAGPSAGSM